MPTKKVTPKEVIEVMGGEPPISVYQAQTLIDFAVARRHKKRGIHGAEREFAHMREELGKAFADPIARIDALDKYDSLFS